MDQVFLKSWIKVEYTSWRMELRNQATWEENYDLNVYSMYGLFSITRYTFSEKTKINFNFYFLETK